jgi:hypothetical protein
MFGKIIGLFFDKYMKHAVFAEYSIINVKSGGTKSYHCASKG